MAVSEMKKLSVICPSDKAEETVRKLMWLSCIDVRKQSENVEQGYEKISGVDSEISEKTKILSKIKESVALLGTYDSKKWEYAIPERQKKHLFHKPDVVDVDEFMESGRYDLAMRKLEKIVALSDGLSRKREDALRAQNEIAMLKAWKNYDAKLSDTKTSYTTTFLGTMPRRQNNKAIISDAESKFDVSVCEVANDERSVYLSVICFKECLNEVTSYFSSKGFVTADFGAHYGYVRDELEIARLSYGKIIAECKSVEEKIAGMIGCEDHLHTLYDIVATEIEMLKTKKKILCAGCVCLIDAWVPTNSYDKVTNTLDSLICAYEFSEPDENDDVPVLLGNNAFATPFEPVVSLYSLPKYKTFDPTFIMSLFYIVIFGLMFADVGYGLILTLGCLIALKITYQKGTMRKFFQMFALCGLSCMVFGALTGGYFGDMPSSVFGIDVDLALWFDPIKDPMTFLYLSLIVGGVHMVTGMLINMFVLIKKGKVFSAIFDVGSWLVLFGGIGTIVFNTKIGLYVTLTGVAMLVFTQGRKEKNIIMKFLKGVISLYSITNYASDLLSYTRILALGLSSAVIAKVINVIAGLFGQSVVGYILLIAVLIVGHLLNMAINILGTFVHTSRLQYIEFFGKFYEEGGTPFETLEPKNKYVIFRNKNQ